MGQVGIAILKRTVFRGGVQHFGNTYHYKSLGLNPTPSNAITLINEVVATERGLHSTDVTFVFGRLWSSGGTPTQNQMINEVQLSGTGTATVNASVDRERAVLVQWPAGTDALGRQVYLRKWWHPCGNIPGVSLTSGKLAQIDPLTTSERNSIATVADQLSSLGGFPEVWNLCAESGREIEGLPITHPWFEHRQFGEEWRG